MIILIHLIMYYQISMNVHTAIHVVLGRPVLIQRAVTTVIQLKNVRVVTSELALCVSVSGNILMCCAYSLVYMF